MLAVILDVGMLSLNAIFQEICHNTLHSYSDWTEVRELSSNLSSFAPFASNVLDVPGGDDHNDGEDERLPSFGETMVPEC